MSWCGQTTLESIDKHLRGGTVVAHGLGNDRRDGYQFPAFPAMAVQGLGIGMSLEGGFALAGIDVGVVYIQGLVLPSLYNSLSLLFQRVGLDCFSGMYMGSRAAE